MHRILLVGLVSLTCVLTGMWLTSYHLYTSFGVDTDRLEGASVRFTYLRVRWPGDGSFRLGGGASLRSLESQPVEPFDLGGAFFLPARRGIPRSLWNRLGFWWINEPRDDEARNVWVFWLGLPSWLPPLLVGAAAFFLARQAREGAQRLA